MRFVGAAVSLALVMAAAACGGPPSSLFNSAGYYVRDDKVYYLQAFPGDAFEIEQADAGSFEILSTTYAKDEGAVYLDGAPLAEADPVTFELLDEPDYSKDAGHVFVRGRVLTEDVAGFGFVGGLAKDSSHVYWSDSSVLSDDPEHFEVVSHDEYYFFAKDRDSVYVQGTVIDGADPATFEVLGGAYAQDTGALYYFTDPVPGADLATFEVIEVPYARDTRHVYWMGKVIPGADPATFVVLNADFECTRDATQAFYRDGPIKDFDPNTLPEGATVTNCDETYVAYS